MIKDILVQLSLDPAPDRAMDYAAAMGSACDANVTGIALCYEPVLPAIDMGEPVPYDFMDAEREANRQLAVDAVERFKKSQLLIAETTEGRVVDASAAGGGEVIGRLARAFDLTIVGQPAPDMSRDGLLVAGALFESGRPVVVVPYTHRGGMVLDRVMVCWDGSLNAARALNDALPLLAKAGSVLLIKVASEKRIDNEDGDIVRHLLRHGLNTSVRHIVVGDGGVSGSLLSEIARSGADMLVMGGYGHSMLREFVLGGVTREILAAAPIPIFLSH